MKNDFNSLKKALVEMIKMIAPKKEVLKKFLESPHYKHIKYLERV